MLKIVTSPDPLLNRVCEPCDVSDAGLAELARQMTETMYAANGVGISAPQVGRLVRLVVVDCGCESDDKDPLVLVNPEVVEVKGEPVTEGEGCLSCPGVTAPVTRPPWARVRFQDLAGDEWEIEGDGLLGRCLQHEVDHLNGITLFESCDDDARIELISAYEAARKAGAQPGETAASAQVR